MSFPTVKTQMAAAGYTFTGCGTCAGCLADIEWWITPANKKMPMDPMPAEDSPAVNHCSTCPDANRFHGRPR